MLIRKAQWIHTLKETNLLLEDIFPEMRRMKFVLRSERSENSRHRGVAVCNAIETVAAETVCSWKVLFKSIEKLQEPSIVLLILSSEGKC
jgi:hypothetical protein